MKQTKEKTRQINFVVSDTEYKQIKKNAYACNQSVSAYIRESALNMCIVPMDLNPIIEYTKGIDAYRNAITQLIYTVKRKGEYVPLDLEYLLEKSKSILKSHQALEKNYLLHIERTLDCVEQTVKNIVSKRLDKE